MTRTVTNIGELASQGSDEALAARAARGDVGAFAALYDRYAARIYAWAAHIVGPELADDAVQEVFIRVWRKGGQFDPQRGRFVSWLMAITRHHLLRELDRRGRQRPAPAEELDELLERSVGTPATEDIAWTHEREREVVAALARLPLEQRRVLVLGYFGGLSQSAMARELGIPLGTVKKRVRLGIQKLRAALRPDEERRPRLRVMGEE